MAVGLAVLGLDPLSLVLGNPQVTVDTFVVHREHRRRGTGVLLLAAAAAYAEETGASHVVAAVGGHEAERQRFFARMGFAPLTTRRIVPRRDARRARSPPGSAAASRAGGAPGGRSEAPRAARPAGPSPRADGGQSFVRQVSRPVAVGRPLSSVISMRKVASVRPRRTGVQTAVTTPDVAPRR